MESTTCTFIPNWANTPLTRVVPPPRSNGPARLVELLHTETMVGECRIPCSRLEQRRLVAQPFAHEPGCSGFERYVGVFHGGLRRKHRESFGFAAAHPITSARAFKLFSPRELMAVVDLVKFCRRLGRGATAREREIGRALAPGTLDAPRWFVRFRIMRAGLPAT